MSIGADMLARRRRVAAAAFVALLLLSLFWPSPIVRLNRLCCNAPLDIDELSFLGREAPSWDVAFWCLAGLLAIAIVQSGERASRPQSLGVSPGDGLLIGRDTQSVRARRPLSTAFAAATLAAIALTFAIARFADARVTAWAEGLQSETTEDFVRIFNRLGGGMNPVLIVVFFALAGLFYQHRRWLAYAIAMAFAGLGAGLVAQIVKFATLRARPELWLGPFQHARSSASSFPSGHTVGSFALAGVLFFGSRNWPLRIIAIVLASAVGLSRIFAFRHWASDVFASAAAGLLVSWVITNFVIRLTSGEREPS